MSQLTQLWSIWRARPETVARLQKQRLARLVDDAREHIPALHVMGAITSLSTTRRCRNATRPQANTARSGQNCANRPATQWATLLYIVPDFEYNNPQ